MSKLKIILPILLGIVAICGLVYYSLADADSEEQVKKLIDRLADAASRRHPADFVSNLHPGFIAKTAQTSWNRQEVQDYLRFGSIRYKACQLDYQPEAVKVYPYNAVNVAEGNFKAALVEWRVNVLLGIEPASKKRPEDDIVNVSWGGNVFWLYVVQDEAGDWQVQAAANSRTIIEDLIKSLP